MKFRRNLLYISLALLALTAAGCAATDVVAKVAETSFGALVAASPGRVSKTADTGPWLLGSPAGDSFYFPADMSGKPDFRFEFDLAPFIAAGLDPARLPTSGEAVYGSAAGKLTIDFELGSEKFPAGARESAEKAFAALVKAKRDRIGYHEELDHYGIALGGGNMFEWAKDMAKNDKDMVFVLNPEPFIAAGVDPAKAAGWAFAKVTIKDEKGKPIQVDKLLKPFNLR